MINIQSLAYVVVESTDLSVWSAYGSDVLGMQVEPFAEGVLGLKMDEHPYRLLVQRGATNRYVASGWALSTQRDFEEAATALVSRGLDVQRGDEALCANRRVSGVLVVNDPSGNRHELVWGIKSDRRRFVSPQGVSGFVTGDMGMGHTVLPAPAFEQTLAFVRDVLGFEISDVFNFCPAPGAPTIPIYFLHCNNARHHSLALMGAPHPAGCVHLMVEVQGMAEVGYAYDRLLKHKIRLSATLGQHSNDRMISFYMKTPGGFDIEYGYDGLNVDWSGHEESEFTAVSLWGHDFSVGFKE